jgi:hypothetical protein
MFMWELVQVTAQYSNAVLVAVLPHLSDFAHKLDLPVPTPIVSSQVLEFKCDPRAGQTGGAVVLTDRTMFTFLDGRVTLYRSPQSYYSLQDPELIPRFYGPVKISEKEAMRIARDAIKKLGYQNSVFDADVPPKVTPPKKIGTNFVSRYLFQWLDPKWPKPSKEGAIVPALLNVEVNASNRRVEMWNDSSPATRQRSPSVSVRPPLQQAQDSKPRLTGGKQTFPVNDAYARSFLAAILPELSAFITKARLDIPSPVTTNQVVTTNYACRILEGKPMAQFYLTNGDRFFYKEGHFSDFYAHDALRKFPDEGRAADFPGPIKMSESEAIAMCENVMRKLGYKGTFPKPVPTYAPPRGTVTFKRYVFYWRRSGEDTEFASFEVDMETRAIKSIFLADPSFQKEAPKIEQPNFPAESNRNKSLQGITDASAKEFFGGNTNMTIEK